MIEKVYKCLGCSVPCILRVQHSCYFSDAINVQTPNLCPFGNKNVKWELVE